MAGLRGRCTGREVYATKGRRNRKTKLSLVKNSRGKAIKFGPETLRRNPDVRGGGGGGNPALKKSKGVDRIT